MPKTINEKDKSQKRKTSNISLKCLSNVHEDIFCPILVIFPPMETQMNKILFILK